MRRVGPQRMKITLRETTPRMARNLLPDSPFRCAWCKGYLDKGLKHFQLTGRELEAYFKRSLVRLHLDCATEVAKHKLFSVTLKASFRSAHRKIR